MKKYFLQDLDAEEEVFLFLRETSLIWETVMISVRIAERDTKSVSADQNIL